MTRFTETLRITECYGELKFGSVTIVPYTNSSFGNMLREARSVLILHRFSRKSVQFTQERDYLSTQTFWAITAPKIVTRALVHRHSNEIDCVESESSLKR